MPRDASGNYTLPSGNPVVTKTAITSAVHNATMADLAAEIQDSLSRTGKGGMSTAFKNADGSEAAPGITFNAETGTGFYRSAAGKLGMAILGVWRAILDSTWLKLNVAIDMNSFPISNVEDPSLAQDAATKNYVDTKTSGAWAALTATLRAGKSGFIYAYRQTTVPYMVVVIWGVNSSTAGTGSIADISGTGSAPLAGTLGGAWAKQNSAAVWAEVNSGLLSVPSWSPGDTCYGTIVYLGSAS